MEDILSSPLPLNTKKRAALDDESPGEKPLNLKGSQFMMPTPPDTDQSSNVSPGGSVNNEDPDRAVSPAPSSSALSSIVEVASNNLLPSSSTTAGPSAMISCASGGPPPAKRRKLTPSEKLERQRAKEASAREKAEEKARKDEDKARKDEEKQKAKDAKDEEKRVKDEEKRKKAEEREAKKREKELDDERKAQEKMKKERNQMRLGAFFQQKQGTPSKQSDNDEDQTRARRRSLSLERYDDVVDQMRKTVSPVKNPPPPASEKKPTESKPDVSDYHRTFLPFVLPSHTEMAPIPPPSDAAQDAFDRVVKNPSLGEQYDLGIVDSYQGHPNVEHYFAQERKMQRGLPCWRMRDLVDHVHGNSQQPIDLTKDASTETPMARMRSVPIKYLHFEEDVRPAYCGTYTRISSPRAARMLGRRPFARSRQDTDYDYDSEAEWQEPEEGDEEVLSDEEDEADSQADANDIDDFLDDEDDTAKNKRKLITGELVPETTGLCWANAAGRICVVDSIEVDEQPKEMHGMRMGVLLPSFSGKTIDPFSSAYWQEPSSSSLAIPVGGPKPIHLTTTSGVLAFPSRAPLQPRLNASGPLPTDLLGAAQGEKGPITTLAAAQGAKRGPKPAPKTLSKEDMEEFKEAVVGSPLGKLDLLKGLKSRFPKLTNEVIKESLSSQFAQIGKGKADKKWVFVGGA